MGLDFSPERGGFQHKFVFCYIVLFLFFMTVFSRLVYLQIIRGNYFAVFSAEHTMKEIRTTATRGIIYDRNRIPIAENRPSFDLSLIPQHVRNLEKVKKTLFEIAQVDPRIVDFRWNKTRKGPSYFPVVIVSDIPYDKAARIRAAKSIEYEESDSWDLRGVDVVSKPLRAYPQGPIAATTLGYVSEVSEKELDRLQKDSPGRYVMGDLVGSFGLEKMWEKYLRGRDGYEQKVVDAVGREIENQELNSLLKDEEPVHGNDLILTLDSRLQKFAEERFRGKAGSLVALDPRNGDVLAMVSLPSYDPSALTSNVSRDYWTTLATDPRHLLLNRAIQGAYPPGSTYKIVTAIAALEEGVVKYEDKINCGGGLQYGGRFFKCWNKRGHGPTSVHRSISESCDTFFYQVGLRLGVDRIAKYANILGMGLKTGIDLEGEKSGLIPTAEWKKKVFKDEWHSGENLSIAVGQGYDTATPLQNALMVAQVATGKRIHPHFLTSIESEDGKVLKRYESKEDVSIPLSPQIMKWVRDGMLDTVESAGGTAHGSRSPLFKMAGKTGTAQVISEEGKARARGINTEDHAWFVVYAPFEDPRIAICVLVEHGGFGASAAAPIAKDVVTKYLELEGLIKTEGSKL